jgi:hypothetical protein
VSCDLFVPLEERDAWDQALREIPHSFRHTREFAWAMYLTTRFPSFLYSSRSNEGCVVCPIVEREARGFVDIATPSGLSGFVGSGNWAEFEQHWSAFVKERGYVCGYVGLHPLFDGLGAGQYASRHNSIYVLDLTVGLDALLRRLDRNRVRQLRGWEARAARFVLDREAISKFLVANYEPFMRRVGARPPYFSHAALDFLCNSDSCIAVGVASSRRLEAVYLFGVTPFGADCLINVATGDGRRHATDLLWYGVNALLEQTIPSLNLGGGSREDDGVARSKQRFGPKRLPLRALKQIYRPEAYAELCRSAGVHGASSRDYFPPYRARAAATSASPV